MYLGFRVRRSYIPDIGITLGLYRDYIGVILGLYRDYIGVILGLYRDYIGVIQGFWGYIGVILPIK